MEAGTRSARPAAVAVFGPFRLDLSTRELSKNGLTLPLEEQPAQVLSLLIERAGVLVSRDELRQMLWPNGVHVDYEHGLNKSINKLRTVLGDDPAAPRLIATLRGRGYRFIAPVEIQEDSKSDLSATSAEDQQHRQNAIPLVLTTEELPVQPQHRRIHPLRVWIVLSVRALAIASVAVAAGVWYLRLRPSAPEAAAPVPLTGEAAGEFAPTFSPGGDQVAYARANAVGEFSDRYVNNNIYIKLIGVPGPPRRLTTQPGHDDSPAWSPDGLYIAFLRFKHEHGEQATVLRIPLTGGPEQALAEVSMPVHFARRLTWFPDGRWLIVSDCYGAPHEPCGLSILSVDTREKRRLTYPPPGCYDVGPAVSPDGRWLVFSRGGDYNLSQLYLLELSTELKPIGEPKQITFENLVHNNPVWTPDGQEIVFTLGVFEPSILERMAVSNGHAGRPQRVTIAGQFLEWPTISRQGKRLVFAHALGGRYEIWRVATSSNDGKAARPGRLIFSSQADEDPDYSPDGRRIAFKSTRSGSSEIWVCDSDGSNATQLTSFGGSSTEVPHWSPDGRRIVFTANANGHSDLFVVDAQGGTPKRLMAGLPGGSFSRLNGRFSRDGRWIYFDSDQTGEWQILKMPSDANRGGGKAVQVTRKGGGNGIESPDGKYFYYVGPGDANPLMKVPVQGGAENQVLPSVLQGTFAVADEGIYFIPPPNQDRFSIQLLSFASGKITRVAEIEKPSGVLSGVFSVSQGPKPAARSILYVQQPQAGYANLMLVENFR